MRSTRTIQIAITNLAVATLLAGCSKEAAVQQAQVRRPEVTSTSTAPIEPRVTQLPDLKPAVPPIPASPEDVKAAWKEGVALFQAGDYETASTKLQIAAAGRTDAYTHYLLGLSLWKSGKAEPAEQALERASSLNPNSAKTWINLARVRMELDKSRTALDAAEEALKLDPLSADALHQKGRALATLGRTDEALESLQKAHEAEPENGYIANTLGYWLIQSGRPADALPVLESAREKLPNVSYVRNNLGVAYERTAQRDKAVDEYRAAVESGDSGGKAAASLARLQSRTGKSEPPKVEGEPIAAVKPGDAPEEPPHK